MKTLKYHFGLILLSSALVSMAVAQQGGEATADVTIRAGAKKWPESNRWTATVKRGGEDRAHYTLEKEIPYGAPYPAIQRIDPDGRSLVVDSFDGVVELYDSRGSLVTTWKPFPGCRPDHERILKCLPVKNGIVFLCSDPGSGSARLIKTDIRLDVLWTRTLAGSLAGELAVSGDGGIFAVCSYISDPEFRFETLIMEADGGVLQALSSLFRTGDFDNEGNRFLLTDGRCVFLGNLRGNLMVTTWRVPERENVVSCARLIPEGGCLVVLQRVKADVGGLLYTEPQLLTLNGEAHLLGRRRLEGESERQATLSLDSGKVTVGVGALSFQCSLSDLK